MEGKITEELDFVSGSSDAAKLGRMLSEERARAATYSEQIAGMKGVLAGLGDGNVLSDSLLCLKTEAVQLEDEYDAIQIAMDALKEADTEIQSRFSPELGRIAGEYMAFVTNGKYENVLLDRNFSAMAKARDDSVARQSDYLSTGTTDLLYLAVRLAVCELALPAGEVCPLIIDDALVNLDETRYSQAISLLAEIAKTRQVIFFTCRK